MCHSPRVTLRHNALRDNVAAAALYVVPCHDSCLSQFVTFATMWMRALVVASKARGPFVPLVPLLVDLLEAHASGALPDIVQDIVVTLA